LIETLVGFVATPALTRPILQIATRIFEAAATTPAAAAAAAAFGPAVGKVLQLAAAAAADDYPPGMDRAAARQALQVGVGRDCYSSASFACASVVSVCRAGLPAQQVQVLQQHCLVPLIKLLGAAPRQYVEERSSAAGAIGQLMHVDAVAGWSLGGREALRTLVKAAADDADDVAGACVHAIGRFLCKTNALVIAEALVAQPGAIPRLLQMHAGAVSVRGGVGGWVGWGSGRRVEQLQAAKLGPSPTYTRLRCLSSIQQQSKPEYFKTAATLLGVLAADSAAGRRAILAVDGALKLLVWSRMFESCLCMFCKQQQIALYSAWLVHTTHTQPS